MKMEDGFYLNAGALYAFKDYSNTIGGVEYKSDEPSIIPSMIGVYKKGNWAAFGAFTIPAGGGKVVYNNGSATTMGYLAAFNFALTQPPYSLPAATYYDTISSQSTEAESIYYGLTLGGAYEFNDLVSIALGARFIDANITAQASIAMIPSALGAGLGMVARSFNTDYEKKADGLGGFIGMSITPKGPFNIGLRYETKTKLDFETSVNSDNTGMIVNGAKEREDLPGLLGIGVGYRINPDIKIDTSFTYYLEKDATRQATRFKDVGNGYDLGMAIEYAFNPKLKGSFGYMIMDISMKPDNIQPEAPDLDAKVVCAGLFYKFKPYLDLNFALLRTFYESEVRSDGIELGKKIISFGLGIQYKFK
jgi:long-chain fatty acid transport protein